MLIRIIALTFLLLFPSIVIHEYVKPDLKQAQCLSLALYHESRGEGIKGRAAVAAVVLNRASKHGMDVCEVVSMPKQFSWYKRKPNMLPVSVLGHLLYDAHLYLEMHKNGTFQDITFGATHFSHKIVNNYWTRKFKHMITIDNHKFYKEK